MTKDGEKIKKELKIGDYRERPIKTINENARKKNVFGDKQIIVDPIDDDIPHITKDKINNDFLDKNKTYLENLKMDMNVLKNRKTETKRFIEKRENDIKEIDDYYNIIIEKADMIDSKSKKDYFKNEAEMLKNEKDDLYDYLSELQEIKHKGDKKVDEFENDILKIIDEKNDITKKQNDITKKEYEKYRKKFENIQKIYMEDFSSGNGEINEKLEDTINEMAEIIGHINQEYLNLSIEDGQNINAKNQSNFMDGEQYNDNLHTQSNYKQSLNSLSNHLENIKTTMDELDKYTENYINYLDNKYDNLKTKIDQLERNPNTSSFIKIKYDNNLEYINNKIDKVTSNSKNINKKVKQLNKDKNRFQREIKQLSENQISQEIYRNYYLKFSNLHLDYHSCENNYNEYVKPCLKTIDKEIDNKLNELNELL